VSDGQELFENLLPFHSVLLDQLQEELVTVGQLSEEGRDLVSVRLAALAFEEPHGAGVWSF